MEVKTDSGCGLNEYDIYFQKKIILRKKIEYKSNMDTIVVLAYLGKASYIKTLICQ